MNDSKAAYCGGILFGTHHMTGENFDVVSRGDWRLRNPMVRKVSIEELQDMATELISAAYASGKNIQIENVSHPQYGMGGYMPTVKIRPSYEKVREAMDTLQARREGKPDPVAKPPEAPSPQLLRCREIYWDESKPDIKAALQVDPAHLPHEMLVKLVREYDRRLMQMWDKVGFEREHGLLDYSKLDHPEVPSLYPALSQAVGSGGSYYLSVFESRYDRGTIAMLAFDMQFPLVVEDFFTGGDDDDAFIANLLKLERYPIAAGKDVQEALLNLDKKLRKVTFTTNTPILLKWLDYVADISGRVKNHITYEIKAVEYEMDLDTLEAIDASGT